MAMFSQMVPVGSDLPPTQLPDLTGEPVDLAELSDGLPLVVMFLCNHCPYVRHVEQGIAALEREFTAEPVRFVAISSNDIENYPDDDIPGLRQQVDRTGWGFRYLVDADQRAAKAFHAACTPDFFVYDADHRLAYRGAFDESNPKNGKPLTGDDLRSAIKHVLAGEPVPEPHRPSMGCGIKWRPGNEPEAVSFL